MNLITALRLNDLSARPCIALVGAGGKSTLLFRLGSELAAAGRQTLLTTTTKIWARQMAGAPFTITSPDEHLLADELPAALRTHGQLLALSGPALEAGKMQGIAPQAVCRMAGLSDVQAVVVEADGSRGRPLKAPAEHEPVIPACATHVINVVGMTALGKPLSADWVHRPELVAQLTGLHIDAPISTDAAARLVVHPEGGLKGHPPGAQSLLYLNLMDSDASTDLDAARDIARAVLRHSPSGGPGFRAVLIGSAAGSQPVLEAHCRIAGVILAAGRGSRLSGDLPKQLLPWDGDTLVGQAAATALQSTALDQVLVVTGYQADRVAAALAGRPVRIVHNPSWAEGQSSSVRAAVEALSPDIGAVLFLLADQPTVTGGAVDAVAAAHRRTLAPIVAPIYRGGRRGNPVLFDRDTFDELASLTGDAGGRTLFQAYGDRVQDVPIDQPQPQGVETWEDYDMLRGATLRRAV
ncbi:MAG: selenium cofactor biosynthesis protein YqeC [Caldilineales bacterium]